MTHRLLVGLMVLSAPLTVEAQPAPSSWQGVPLQIIPAFQEQGAPTFTSPSGSGAGTSQGSTGGSASGAGIGGNTGSSIGSGALYDTLAAQSYGQPAIDTAQQLGNNPNALAAFAQLESGFRNVPTANGSSSATGPWQITAPTWNEYVSRYNLPYTAADRTNPAAQAVVSNYVLRDYANQVSISIGQPATVQQAYGAWVYGPASGSGLASASDPNTPLSNFASASNLAKNNMTGWTVGQFNAFVGSKVGSVATQTVRA